MMNSIYRTAIVLTLLAVLSGCSLFGKNEPEYLAAVEVEPLRVPPGMSQPASSEQVTIAVPDMRMPSGDELEPKPPRVVSTAGKADSDAYMAWSAQGVYLLLEGLGLKPGLHSLPDASLQRDMGLDSGIDDALREGVGDGFFRQQRIPLHAVPDGCRNI